MSYKPLVGHQSMLFDDVRNSAYRQALEELITPDSVVMDLGAGLGIHGLLAAQLGAKRVYMVEPATNLEFVRQVVKANHIETDIRYIPKTIEQAELDEKVDVILSVFTGNFLLDEDLLPSLLYARDHHLAEGGSLIPGSAQMMLLPVTAEAVFQDNLGKWSTDNQGVDYSTLRQYAANSLYHVKFQQQDYLNLSAPCSSYAIDFHTADTVDCNVEHAITVTRSGICHGILGWFDMQLGVHELSTGPEDEPTHWSQVFLPLDTPLEVSEGEVLQLKLQRPAYGEWSWRLQAEAGTRKHSTSFSDIVSLQRLNKKSGEYQPALTGEGEATLYVLQAFTKAATASQIAEDVFSKFNHLFVDDAHARRFVDQHIEHYAE